MPDFAATKEITIKGRLQKHVVQDYMTQIVSALDHLHMKRVIDRNLCPENIMLTDSFTKIKLGGFSNMCNLPSQGECVSLRGENVEYLSPEQILQNSVGFECDIWGLGCLISEMLYCTFCGRRCYESCSTDFKRRSDAYVELNRKGKRYGVVDAIH